MRRKIADAAAKPIPLYFVSSADGKTPVNDPANIAVALRKNGGAEVVSAGAVGAGASGWHWWTPSAADLSTLGEVTVAATADACDPFPFVFTVAPTNDVDEWDKISQIGVGGSLPIGALSDVDPGLLYAGADYHADSLTPIDVQVDGKPDMTGRPLFLGLGTDPNGTTSIVVVEDGVVVSGAAGDQVIRFQPRKSHTDSLLPFVGKIVTGVVSCDFLLGAGPDVLYTPVATQEFEVRSMFRTP